MDRTFARRRRNGPFVRTLRWLGERTVYGHEISEILEMNRRVDGPTLRPSVGASQSTYRPSDRARTDHKKTEEAQRHEDKGERRALPGQHSQDHAHEHGRHADSKSAQRKGA